MLKPISPAEAAGKIQAAFRLFLTFDPKQLDRFGDDIPSVWKSFWGPILVLPLHLLIMTFTDDPTAGEAGFLTRVVADLSAYAIDVVYWPLAMVMIADLLQKPERYARYIAAYNWVAVPVALIASAILLIFGIEGGTLGLPGIVLTFWMLLFRIRLARMAFDAPVMIAVAMTAGDFFLGLLVISMRAGVLG